MLNIVGVAILSLTLLVGWRLCEAGSSPFRSELLSLGPPGFRASVLPRLYHGVARRGDAKPGRQLSFSGDHDVSQFKQHGKGFSFESGFRMDFAKEHIVEKDHPRGLLPPAPPSHPVAPLPVFAVDGCTVETCGTVESKDPCTGNGGPCQVLDGSGFQGDTVVVEELDVVSLLGPPTLGDGFAIPHMQHQAPIMPQPVGPELDGMGMHGKEMEKTSEKQLRNSADFYINVGGSFDMLSNVVRSAFQNRRKHGGGLLQNLFGRHESDSEAQQLPPEPHAHHMHRPLQQSPVAQPVIIEPAPPQVLPPIQLMEVIDLQGPDIEPPRIAAAPCATAPCSSDEFLIPQFDCEGTLDGDLPHHRAHNGVPLTGPLQRCGKQAPLPQSGAGLINLPPGNSAPGNSLVLPPSMAWLQEISQDNYPRVPQSNPAIGGGIFGTSSGATVLPSNGAALQSQLLPQQAERPILTGNRIKRLTRLLK